MEGSKLTGYDPQMAVFLAKICRLTYTQYYRGKKSVGYDGAIEPPSGYRQVAAFTAPEMECTNYNAPQLLKRYLLTTDPGRIDLSDLALLEKIARGIKRAYFGLALEATDGSGIGIIALRGTVNLYEWLLDMAFLQTPTPLVWFTAGELTVANAHFGFLFLYAFLITQIAAVVKKFTKLQICYVTGHSLGGALAVLAVLTVRAVLALSSHNKQVQAQLYNYGSPRVGDPGFTAAFDHLIPCSYRIINLCDVVTLLPPEKILNCRYHHVGGAAQEWSFLHQTGDVGRNHSLDTYTAALTVSGAVTNLKRLYPCPGL
jgi:triacylglycerol lipase